MKVWVFYVIIGFATAYFSAAQLAVPLYYQIS